MLTWQKITLKLKTPFRIAYGTSEERTTYWIRLDRDEGWGEGTIPSYYNIPFEDMEACWQAAAGKNVPYPDDPAEIPAWVGEEGPAPARCGLDLALLDRIGRLQNKPLYALLNLPYPAAKASSFTISIDTPEKMAEIALQTKRYPSLKIKLGGDEFDMERLQAIRAARPDAKLRIDANAGWTLENALGYIKAMEKIGLELIEQPLDKANIQGLGIIQSQTDIPIVADESVQTMENVEQLARAGVRGINIKLMKVGGVTPALAMIRRARELGMQVMLGCMIETSLGITAMAHLGGIADWLDLDAPVLLKNDPFDGMIFDDDAKVHILDRPGIGVILKD